MLDFLKDFLLFNEKLKVRSAYSNRPKLVGEVLSDELITEQTGYRTLEQQVTDLIVAGQRLDDYRRGIYDSDNHDIDDDDYFDPTRSPDFDMFDALDGVSHLKATFEAALSKAASEANESEVESEAETKKKIKEEIEGGDQPPFGPLL